MMKNSSEDDVKHEILRLTSKEAASFMHMLIFQFYFYRVWLQNNEFKSHETSATRNLFVKSRSELLSCFIAVRCLSITISISMSFL